MTPSLVLIAALLFQQEGAPPVRATSDTGPVVTSTATTTSDTRLKAGTPIPLKLAQSIKGKHVRAGQVIEFAVSEDVKAGDKIIIPMGTRVLGYVSDSVPGEGLGKGGRLAVQIDELRLRGKMIKLTGDLGAQEKRATGKVVGMTIAFGLMGFLSAKGNSPDIPEGTALTAYLAEDISVEEPR